LPGSALIGGVGKIAEMIWKVKHFQTISMSALIADSNAVRLTDPADTTAFSNSQDLAMKFQMTL
jgi:hypothetical protein